MNRAFIFLFPLLVAAVPCAAIDYYRPGDTLWVWAQSGLNMREKPDAQSKVLGKIAFGGQVIAADYRDRDFPYAVEAIKKGDGGPNLELSGYWAKVTYGRQVGYVFDAYLSKLPTMFGQQYETQTPEDIHVAALEKHSKIVVQQGKDQYENDRKFVRYIFDKGYIIEIAGGSGYWTKEMLFPGGLSVTEGYLIYLNTFKSESDVLIEKGEDHLIFQVPDGTVTIKKAGSFLVIFEEHAC